jgi:hypothetical protein
VFSIATAMIRQLSAAVGVGAARRGIDVFEGGCAGAAWLHATSPARSARFTLRS